MTVTAPTPRFAVPNVQDELTRQTILRYHDGMHASFNPQRNIIQFCWLPEAFDASKMDVDWFIYVLNHEYLHWIVYHVTGSVEICKRLDNVDDGTFSITDDNYDMEKMLEGAVECPSCGGNYVQPLLDGNGDPIGEECIDCEYLERKEVTP